MIAALKDSSIRFITTRHEQGAAFMAEGERPGATHIDLPVDVAKMKVPFQETPLVKVNSCIVEYASMHQVEFAPNSWNPHGTIRIVNVSRQAASTNKCYQCSVDVVGDITESLNSITRRSSRAIEPEAAMRIKKRFEEDQKQYKNDESFPMKPQRILSDVRKLMGRKDIMISDVGAHKLWIARLYNCYEPNTCIISNGFASMGISVPGAIAAKLLHPAKKILTITGDGGFMMNSQELETAARMSS